MRTPTTMALGILAGLMMGGAARGQTPTPTPTPTSAAATPVDGELATLRARLSRTLRLWQEHREQTIEVKEIKGLEGSAETRPALEERLKTLLTKKRSNREWLGYWQGEQRYAEELAAIYAALAPAQGPSPLEPEIARLGAARDVAAKAADGKQAELAALDKQITEAKGRLEARLEATRGALPELTKASEAADKALAPLAQRVERAAKRLEAAPEDARAPLQAELTAAREAAAKAEAQAQAARAAVAAAGALVGYVGPLLSGEVPAGEAPSDPAIKADIELVANATSRTQVLKDAVATAATAHAAAEAALAEGKRGVARYRARTLTLQRWAELAVKKQANQEVFYKAIAQDIEAVEERLRGVQEDLSREHIGAWKTECEGPRAAGQTSLERYYGCLDALDKELEELGILREDTIAAIKLNRTQQLSVDHLLAAQRTDETLVREELEIAQAEVDRATETEPGVASWRGIWETYASRAASKVKELSRAVVTTRDTVRALRVNEGFYESEQIGYLDRALDRMVYRGRFATAGRWVVAALATAWQYLRNAYMVPLYLLLAWLLLRTIRRAGRRYVTRVKAKAETIDETQRAETLTEVGQRAFKLVVTIATFLLILDALTVDIGPILGGAAIFGLAISFGSQSLVKDFVTGFFIVLEDQYSVGDAVEVAGKSGTVEAITLRRTVLRDLQGALHSIPNGSISNVINKSQGWSRVVVHIGVAYGSDLDEVKRIVDALGDEMAAEEAWKDKLSEPPRYVGLTQFGDNALTVRIMFKTQILENWGAEREFNHRLLKAFNEAGVGIPFPQRDLHIISTPESRAKGEEGAAGQPSGAKPV